MNKTLKWFLAGLGVLVLLTVIGSVVLPLIVDPNDYKEEIRAAIHKQTNRELAISGEIEWTVFPWAGLTIKDVELSNPDGFGSQPMLKIGEAGLSVKLLTLVGDKLELGKIVLDDLTLNLHRKADGQSNWADLVDASPERPVEDDDETGSFVLFGIEINNADINWNDAGQLTQLKNVALEASNVELGKPFDLEGSFSVGLDQPQLAGAVRFGGKIRSEADGTRYGIDNFEVGFTGIHGSEEEPFSLELAMAANVDINLASDRAELTDFSLRFHNVLTTGNITVTSLSGEPGFEGQLDVAEFNPRSLMAAVGMQAPLMASESALTSLQAKLNFSGSTTGFNMQKLIVKFDESSLEGGLNIQNFEHPQVAFDFGLDSVNVDNYLSTAESTESENLSIDVFRGFTGGGDLRIGRLVVANLVATNASLKLTGSGSGVRLFPIDAQVYGGLYHGDILIDASGNRPLLTTSQDLSGIQAEALLQDLTGNPRLAGSGNFSSSLSADLSNTDATLQTLSGTISLRFLDGAIVGINVAESIRTAKGALGLGGNTTEVSERDPKTDFSELSMTGSITNGLFDSDDLMMLSPLLRVTGKGQADLVRETIDFLVKPTVVGTLEGQGGQELEELSGIPIPVKFSGNLYAPDIGIDIMAAIGASQKAKIDKKKDEFISDLLENNSDKTDGANTENIDQPSGNESDQNEKSDDPAQMLLQGLFGGKKDKKKDGSEDDGE